MFLLFLKNEYDLSQECNFFILVYFYIESHRLLHTCYIILKSSHPYSLEQSFSREYLLFITFIELNIELCSFEVASLMHASKTCNSKGVLLLYRSILWHNELHIKLAGIIGSNLFDSNIKL